MKISLLVICTLVISTLAFLPSNTQPCFGPAFDDHPALQAECLHQLTVRSTGDTKDSMPDWMLKMRNRPPHQGPPGWHPPVKR